MAFDANHLNCRDLRSIRSNGIPVSEFKFGNAKFRLSANDDGDVDGSNLPVSRDQLWQEMLMLLLGHVPDGAEEAPPCNCQLHPLCSPEEHDFSGLAGLPPAVRLMDGFFPVRDQSKRGACFAFALVALCEYMLGRTVELSEQSLFHFTKLVTPGKVEDLGDGAISIDAIHAVEEYGICPLSEWHYNPESWNYVEDPNNEGQSMALQRKLEMARQYRFRNWQTLSAQSVLQFKQVLSSGRPIYTGVPVVGADWFSKSARTTGKIPYPRAFWEINILPPPPGLVEGFLADNGLEANEENAQAAARALMTATLNYVCEKIFADPESDVPLEVVGVQMNEGGVAITVCTVTGGHALCLAGYVDDANYPGGGYFIARNSWSDSSWAPESPEAPGYALLPYSLISDFGQEGYCLADFPSGNPSPRFANMTMGAAGGGFRVTGALGFASPRQASWPQAAWPQTPVPQPAMRQSASFQSAGCPQADSGFEAWLASRRTRLTRPMRSSDGLLLPPGTPVLVPDPANPAQVMRDTPENLAELRALYERQVAEATAKEEAARLAFEAKAAADREGRFAQVVKDVIDSTFAADDFAVLSLAALKERVRLNDPDLVRIAEFDKRVRNTVIALQKSNKRKYWFGHGFGNTEEVRPCGKDSERIFV